MLIYDGLACSLQRLFGFFSIGTSLGGLYLFYTTHATYSLGLNAAMHWGGLTWFTWYSISIASYIFRRRSQVARLYLLAGGHTARIQFANGVFKDVSVASMTQKGYSPQTTALTVEVQGDKVPLHCRVVLNYAQVCNHYILFGMTRDHVHSIST